MFAKQRGPLEASAEIEEAGGLVRRQRAEVLQGAQAGSHQRPGGALMVLVHLSDLIEAAGILDAVGLGIPCLSSGRPPMPTRPTLCRDDAHAGHALHRASRARIAVLAEGRICLA